jgi:transposase
MDMPYAKEGKAKEANILVILLRDREPVDLKDVQEFALATQCLRLRLRLRQRQSNRPHQ